MVFARKVTMSLEQEFFKIIEQGYPESQPSEHEDKTLEDCQNDDIEACKHTAKRLIQLLTERIDALIKESNLAGRQTGKEAVKILYAGKIVGLIEFKKQMGMI